MIRSALVFLTCLFAIQLIFPKVVFSESVMIRFADGEQETQTIQHLFNANGELQETLLERVKTLTLKTRLEVSKELKIFVQLTNGDILFVDQIKSVDDSFEVEFFGESLLLPIEIVREVTWKTTQYEYQRLKFPAGVDDIVALENGDLVKGEFIAIEEQELRIVTDVGLIKIPAGKVKTLTLSAQLSEEIKQPQRAYECYFSNGSVVTVDSLAYSEKESQFQFRFADLFKFSVPQKEITRIEIWSERFKRISKDHLKSHSSENFFGAEQQVFANFNSDRQLLITSQMSSKFGFGVRSHSRLTFEIPAEAVSVCGVVGLDARGTQNGAVNASILVDGQIVWQAVLDRFKSPSFDLPVISVHTSEVQKAFRKLELVVDFGATADVGDQVNWQGIYFELLTKD
jgi:hypothetical protein